MNGIDLSPFASAMRQFKSALKADFVAVAGSKRTEGRAEDKGSEHSN